MSEDSVSPYGQGRALWELLRDTSNLSAQDFALFSALEEVYDERLMGARKRLELEDFRREARVAAAKAKALFEATQTPKSVTP